MALRDFKRFLKNMTTHAAVSLFTLHYLTTMMTRPLFDSLPWTPPPRSRGVTITNLAGGQVYEGMGNGSWWKHTTVQYLFLLGSFLPFHSLWRLPHSTQKKTFHEPKVGDERFYGSERKRRAGRRGGGGGGREGMGWGLC